MSRLLVIRFVVAVGVVLGLGVATWAGPNNTRLLEEFAEEFDRDELPWRGSPALMVSDGLFSFGLSHIRIRRGDRDADLTNFGLARAVRIGRRTRYLRCPC